MRIRVEVAGQVRLDDLRVASDQQAVDRSHRIVRRAITPVGILIRRQIRIGILTRIVETP